MPEQSGRTHRHRVLRPVPLMFLRITYMILLLEIGEIMGRNKKLQDLTDETFEGFCALGWSIDKVAEALNVNKNTLNRWCIDTYGTTFGTIKERKRAECAGRLRASGLEMAMTNVTANIFWAKACGISDDPEAERRKKEEHEIKLKQLRIELERKKLELEKLRLEVEALKNSGDDDEIDL